MSEERSEETKKNTGDKAEQSPSRRAPSVWRILLSVVVASVLLRLAQLILVDQPMLGIIAFSLVAAVFVGWRMDVLRSVRTAVVLLAALSLSCVLATLTVQRQHLETATDEQFQETVSFAWAHLLVKVSHPFPRSVELAPEHVTQLERMEAVFGAKVAKEDRERFTKGMIAAEDEQRAQELAAKHPMLFVLPFEVVDAIGLTDAYKSWWFIGLFYLLTLNLVFGAVTRRKPSLRNVGFHCAHLGLVLVVLGATAGAFLGVRGFVPLHVGQPVDAFLMATSPTDQPLGFSVRLDRIETLYHEDLSIGAFFEDEAGPGAHHAMGAQGSSAEIWHTEKLELGKELTLTEPGTEDDYVLTIEEISEASGFAQEVRAVEPGTEGAVLAAKVSISGGMQGEMWLEAGNPPYIDPANRFKVRVAAANGDTDPTAAATSDCAEDEGLGWLTVGAQGSEPMTVPVRPGETVQMGPLAATFGTVIPDFKVGAGDPKLTDIPRNPALRVGLVDGEGQGGEYLLFASEHLKDFTQLPWPGIDASYEYDYWCSPTGARVDLRVGPGGATRVIASIAGEDPVSQELVAGGTMALPGGSLELTLLEALPASTEEWVMVHGAPEGQEDLPMRTALRLGIEGPAGTSEEWLLSNTRRGELRLGGGNGKGAGNLVVRFGDNRNRMPRDWHSTLTFLEEGVEVASGLVEVNVPQCYNGYCFFQSDADASRPDYSGLQVVKDPAWVPVKLGLWMLLLGISWCFYVQPMFDRRARARAAAKRGDAS